MTKTYQTAILIKGDASGGVKAVKATQAQVDALNQSVNKNRQSMDNYRKTVKRTGKSLGNFSSQAKAALGILSGAALAKEALALADSYKQMQARLQLATDSQHEFNIAQEELKRISAVTHTALQTNVTLYSRMAIATKELNIDQRTLLDASESLQHSFRVYGTSSEEAASATLQLTQAMAKGKLDGDEFRSVMENAPLVMEALKDALGITKKELFEFSKDGKLAVEDLVNALAGNLDKFAAQSAEVPTTIAEAMIDAKNEIQVIIGEFDEATGASDKLIAAIGFLAANFGTLISVIGGFAALKLLGPTIFAVGTAAVTTARNIQVFGAGLVALNAKAAATTAVMTGLKSAMAFLGGPAGVAILAGVALYKLSDSMTDVSVAGKAAKKAIDEVQAALDNGVSGGADEFEKLRKKLAGVNKQIEDMRNINALDALDTKMGRIALTSNKVEKALLAQKEELEKQLYITEKVSQAKQFLSRVLEEHARITEEEATKRAEANDPIEKQIEALKESNEALRLEKVRVFEGVEAYRELVIAKISASDADQALKDKLIELTREQWALNDSIKAYTTQQKQSEAVLKNARDLIKGLVAQQNPLKAMFQGLAKDLATLNEAKLEPDFSPEEFDEGMQLLANQGAEAFVNTITEIFNNIPPMMGGAFKEAREEIDEELKKIELDKAFDGFANGLNPAISAFQAFGEEISLIRQKFKDMEGDLNGKGVFYSTGLSAEFALNSMANMAEAGSSAQAKLSAAAAVANTALGISAILTQGQGDPWTAIPRMIAMAAMVASTGTQVTGAFGGSGAGGAEQRQQRQGTGTVLGDENAKSESIQNSLDLIAEASEKIVGINSKMLRSLNTMNNAIAATVTQIAQVGGIGDLGTQSGGFGGASGIFAGSGVTGFLDGLIFGRSKIRDRGIQILSGSISDAISGDIFQAYEVARRSGIFGSRTRTQTGDLEAGIANQISLIFGSMQDAILAGAEALGVNVDDVQAALDAYQIEEQRISLLDLSAEDQQAELEAVFSSIFDGLVDVSLPFIAQFQEAGEGLGETLARVSTTVLVFEEAIGSMGLDFIAKQVDPERFAQAAVAIADFAGGLDEFIDGYTSYINNFLTDSQQFDIVSERLTGVFSGLDLELPDTRAGFTDLIQGLDLTTAAGQEAFGTLISLSDEIDSFYNGVERLEEALKDYNDFSQSIQDDINAFDMTDFQLAMRDIREQEAANIAQLEELAQAAGMASAAEEDLARVHELAARQTAAAIAALTEQVQDLVAQLYGTEASDIDEQIALLEGRLNSGVNAVGGAAENLFEQWQRSLERIRDYSQSLLIDNRFSPLEAPERLQEALADYWETYALAQAGDLDAVNDLTGLADIILGLNQQVNTSGEDANEIFYLIKDSLDALGIPAGVSPSSGNLGTVNVGVSAELQALYDRRAAIEAAEMTEHRLELARQLAVHVGDLAAALNQPVFQVLADMGVNLDEYLQDLGINVADASVETVAQLASLSNTLGVEITDLADQVGLDLGSLADAQSLLNDGLESVINGLPSGISGSLNAALRAIENASSPEERERLLGLMETDINALPLDLRNQLAPFFDGVDVETPASATATATEAINTLLASVITPEGMTIAGLGDMDIDIDLDSTGFGTITDSFQNAVDDFVGAINGFAGGQTGGGTNTGGGNNTGGGSNGGHDDNQTPFQPPSDPGHTQATVAAFENMTKKMDEMTAEIVSLKARLSNKLDESIEVQEATASNTAQQRQVSVTVKGTGRTNRRGVAYG